METPTPTTEPETPDDADNGDADVVEPAAPDEGGEDPDDTSGIDATT